MSYATIPTLINHGRRLTPARLEVRLIKGMRHLNSWPRGPRAAEANQRLRAALDAMVYRLSALPHADLLPAGIRAQTGQSL